MNISVLEHKIDYNSKLVITLFKMCQILVPNEKFFKVSAFNGVSHLVHICVSYRQNKCRIFTWITMCNIPSCCRDADRMREKQKASTEKK